MVRYDLRDRFRCSSGEMVTVMPSNCSSIAVLRKNLLGNVSLIHIDEF
jgi:hypothetical protein